MPTTPPMPHPFQPGDVVRCLIPDVLRSLARNHIYTVGAVQQPHNPAGGGLVYLNGFFGPFLSTRFEIVARAPANDVPAEAAHIPRQMAQVFRERLSAEGCCTVDDLAHAGFTAAQIIEYSDEARGLAGLAGEVA